MKYKISSLYLRQLKKLDGFNYEEQVVSSGPLFVVVMLNPHQADSIRHHICPVE